MRVPPRQIDDANDDVAPCHAREARADNRIWRRGAMFVQKLWRMHFHNERVDSPLPSIRGKR
jgi:hypothetical protein